MSNIDTIPCYEWLVSEVEKWPPIRNLSVKNSHDFADRIEDIRVDDNESIVSFDVSSLFPSIPVNIALDVDMTIEKIRTIFTYSNFETRFIVETARIWAILEYSFTAHFFRLNFVRGGRNSL